MSPGNATTSHSRIGPWSDTVLRVTGVQRGHQAQRPVTNEQSSCDIATSAADCFAGKFRTPYSLNNDESANSKRFATSVGETIPVTWNPEARATADHHSRCLSSGLRRECSNVTRVSEPRRDASLRNRDKCGGYRDHSLRQEFLWLGSKHFLKIPRWP